jgi:hypothetical protein
MRSPASLLLAASLVLAPAAALSAPPDCVLQTSDSAGNVTSTGAMDFSFGGQQYDIVAKPNGTYLDYRWDNDPYSEDTMRCSLIWSPRSNFTDWLVTRMNGGKTPPLDLSATLTSGGAQSTYAFGLTAPQEIVFPGVSTDVQEERFLHVSLGYGTGLKTSNPPRIGVKQKAWLCNNFRLSIDGVDTSGVVNSKSVQWEPHKAPGLDSPEIEVFSPLVVTFTSDHVAGWADWFKSAGVPGQIGKRNGKLEYLDRNGAVLLTLEFHNLGLYKVTPEKMEAGAEGIRRFKAEMFLESVVPIFPS